MDGGKKGENWIYFFHLIYSFFLCCFLFKFSFSLFSILNSVMCNFIWWRLRKTFSVCSSVSFSIIPLSTPLQQLHHHYHVSFHFHHLHVLMLMLLYAMEEREAVCNEQCSHWQIHAAFCCCLDPKKDALRFECKQLCCYDDDECHNTFEIRFQVEIVVGTGHRVECRRSCYVRLILLISRLFVVFALLLGCWCLC